MYAELRQKVCARCKELKDVSQFNRDSAKKSGLGSYCAPCRKKQRGEWKTAPERKEYEFKTGLKRNYGITTEQYQIMFNQQNGCCAICGIHQKLCKRSLAVDHCHESGQIRSLLCDNCNPGLGYFKHSTERLYLAIAYLEKFKK